MLFGRYAHSMTDQPRSPTIREAFVDVLGPHGVNKWRVYEPMPLKSSRVVGHVLKLLGPLLVQVIAGRIRLPKAEPCPSCGAGNPEQINGDRWLCKSSKDGDPCNNVWAVDWLRDEKGNILRLTWGMATSTPAWQLRLAEAVSEQLNALDDDGEKVEKLICSLLVGACEVTYPGGATHKITTADDLDLQASMADNGPAALLALAKAAIASWVLPIVRGELLATSRGTTAT